MNVPNRSSPTTPANATRRPSRAAPHARIAPDPPIVRVACSTSRSACPNAGSTSPPLQDQVGVRVAEHQQVEVRHGPNSRGSGRRYDGRVTPRIELVIGDITTQAVDAIVNAANTALRPGGGVDGAITRAAGTEALADRERVVAERGDPPLPTGDAVATTGGDLSARWIIHTAGPVYSGSDRDPELLALVPHRRACGWPTSSARASSPSRRSRRGIYGYPVARGRAHRDRSGAAGADTKVGVVRFVLFRRRGPGGLPRGPGRVNRHGRSAPGISAPRW